MKATFINKLKWNGIVTIGGLFIGAGFADCLLALNDLDLNQIARGLTIFSAGLTILVVMDNSKTQRKAEEMQRETQLHLEQIDAKLQAMQQIDARLQAMQQSLISSEKQTQEMKQLLYTSNAVNQHNNSHNTIVNGDDEDQKA